MSEHSLKDVLGPTALAAAKRTRWWQYAELLAQMSYGLCVTGPDVGKDRMKQDEAWMHVRVASLTAWPDLTETSLRGVLTDMAHEFEKRAIFDATK